MTWRTIQSGGPLFAKALWSLWSLWWMVMVWKRVGSIMKIKTYLLHGSGTPLSSLLADLTPLLIWWQVWWFNDWLVCRHRLISKCNNRALLAEKQRRDRRTHLIVPLFMNRCPLKRALPTQNNMKGCSCFYTDPHINDWSDWDHIFFLQKCEHWKLAPYANSPTHWVLKSRRAPAECLVSSVGKYTKWAVGMEESEERGVWGFNQGSSESLFEDSMGSSQWLGANSNPQVFRLNLLNFLNAAPHHAPMLRLATIYKVSHANRLPPKTNSLPSFSAHFPCWSVHYSENIPVTASLKRQTWVWSRAR